MNEAKILTLEAGKYYRTRGGHKVFIIGENPFDDDEDVSYGVGGFVKGEPGEKIKWWSTDGKAGQLSGKTYDILAEWVEPKRIKGKMFICQSSSGTFGSYISDEPRDPLWAKIIACIEIDVLEGAGLGENGA